MENAAKALEMAAGVLLGVILMALVAYFFTTISTWPKNEEDVMSVEQLSKFNLEYEVYEKTKMYGVDVISCLNKVISNNSKYAQGGAFLGGNAGLADYKQRENFWINVKIKLKQDKTDEEVSATSGIKLYESIEVLHCDINNKEVARTSQTTGKDGQKLATVAINSKGLERLKSAVDKVGRYTTLKSSDTLPTDKIEDERTVDVFTDSKYIVDGYISLVYRQSDGNVSDMNSDIVDLLHKIQTISTADSISSFTYTFKNTTKADFRIWTQIKWKTVLADLKSRKFTCANLTYNTTTGRVNEIVFEEV